jgi:hypothetical protein
MTLSENASRMFSSSNLGCRVYMSDLRSYYHVRAETIYVIVVIHLDEQQNMVVVFTGCASPAHT